jgi:hypothetical protein
MQLETEMRQISNKAISKTKFYVGLLDLMANLNISKFFLFYRGVRIDLSAIGFTFMF